MMDTFNVPDSNMVTSVFYANGSWQTWQKPKNCKFVQIFTLGSGGGGGGGGRNNSGVIRIGGVGGAGAAYTRAFFQAQMLPNILYIQVPNGGVGGAASSNGSAGGLSYVCVLPDTNVLNTLVRSGNAGAAGGLAASGSASAAGTVATIGNYLLGYLGYYQSNAGANGAGGTGGGAGTSVTISNIVTGGAGGGGASSLSFSGGSINELGFIPKIHGAIDNTVVGSPGYSSILSFNTYKSEPLFFTGGSGGAGSNLGSGTNGGNGGFGCGGGGGGAGLTGTVGGYGGNGGDGLVIITAW